jgi:hypothetical protein
MEGRTFRMDQLSDIEPALRRDDYIFEADKIDAYYHLSLRKEYQPHLTYSAQ